MFAIIIRRGLWFQTLQEEDHARRRLQETVAAHSAPCQQPTPTSSSCSVSPESIRALITRSLQSVGTPGASAALDFRAIAIGFQRTPKAFSTIKSRDGTLCAVVASSSVRPASRMRG